MQRHSCSTALVVSLLIASPVTLADSGPASEEELTEITVSGQRVANQQPAGSYAAPVTTLRFDPLIEIQSRGIAEGQADITVRGSVFENTGMQLGAVSIVDPQTGHYVVELPVDPAFLSMPSVLLGIDNAVSGFNSAVATVSYEFRALQDGGSVSLGAGTDDLDFQSLRFARTGTTNAGNTLGTAASVSRSQGDGSVPNGDHQFSRYNVHVQRVADGSQSDMLFSYQDKFFGWPGAYTGFATLNEIDDTQTTLLMFNHRANASRGWWEIGAAYRRLVDDYDFDRSTIESGVPGSFEHETRNMSIGLQGLSRIGRIDWRYGAQLSSDELVRSTDLTNGDFDSRRYATLTVVPSVDIAAAAGTLTLRGGATVDYSSRDSNAVLPLIGMTLVRQDAGGDTAFGIEYAATSQLPGYTALKSNPSGLFGGNPDLGRERAKQLSLTLSREAGDWQGRLALFSRRDDKLVDWTYASGAPFARQANAVDIDVTGFEALLTRQWPLVDLVAGYTYLDKDADYGTALVDASFYALNFARHRATLAVRYQLAAGLELRLDNEYRRQQKNPLRDGDDSTYLAALSVVWKPAKVDGLDVSLIADNLTDSEYQPFPGTPAPGRQVSLSASYAW